MTSRMGKYGVLWDVFVEELLQFIVRRIDQTHRVLELLAGEASLDHVQPR
jgi:hypothetical protein